MTTRENRNKPFVVRQAALDDEPDGNLTGPCLARLFSSAHS